jgi:curved DNA-binding protein CbpA
MHTLYEVLDLPPDADEQSVKTAYRALARRFHPDLNGGDVASAERLAKINEAYATLGNPEARAAYDRDMAQRRAAARRRYAIFAAISLSTFIATAGAVSLAVRQHLGASAAAVSPSPSGQGTRGPMVQSPMPGAGLPPHGGDGLTTSLHHPSAASWTTFRDARFDFALRYPAGIFAFDAAQSSANFHTFVSRDGRATLRIVAAENTAGVTLAGLRRSLMKERYAGATFDKAPRRKHWFALSGTRGGEVFLERVTFSCDGKSMHGWQMLYPASERAGYDELAKLVLRNYPHGNGPGAGCAEARPAPRARSQARRKR